MPNNAEYNRRWRNTPRGRLLTRRSRERWAKSETGQRSKRNSQLQIKFGITIEQYEELLAKQGGACAICREKCRSGRNLAVDHDHETGVIRGLLCSGCNTSIGALRNLRLLEAAISYLWRHR